jgi:hypothetical protein
MNKLYTLLTAFIFFMMSAHTHAQVTLNNSPYTENFNNLGTAGLPAGFTVKKLATATALGTDTILNASGAAATWGEFAGGFKNFASSTTVTSPVASTTVQAASTDRALGVRQTQKFGDSGAAFVFQISNTVAKKNFQLNFKLQSLDSTSRRITTWTVDYATGANPTSFTPLTTSPSVLTTGGSTVFTNTTVNVDFGSALDNINDVVYIRVVALKNAVPGPGFSGGNRASTGIDDWNLSWQEVGASVSNIIRDENYLSLSGNLTSKLNITFNKAISSSANVQVLSLNGRVVYQKQLPKVFQGQNEDISGLNLSSGVYILKIVSKEGVYSTKLVR